MRYLVKFDFGLRDSFGEELRLLTEEQFWFVKGMFGTEIYLGEIEGKHSEVYGDFEESDFKLLKTFDDACEFVKEFDTILPQGFGINIFEALEEKEKENT